MNPRDAKAKMAKEIATLCYGKNLAERAEKEFNKVFKEDGFPLNIPQIKLKEKSLNLLDLLIKVKLVGSKSEAKRLVLQKGVKIDKEIQGEWKGVVKIKKGLIVQVGKRKFAKIT